MFNIGKEAGLEKNMIILAVSILLASLSVLVHYEFLVLIERVVMRKSIDIQTLSIHSRWLVCVVLLILLLAHTVEILLFAVTYQILGQGMDMGSIQGAQSEGFQSVVYFSFSSYTTLGTGDLFPVGALRILAGFEGLLGLLLIGWSASFLYLEMRALRF